MKHFRHSLYWLSVLVMFTAGLPLILLTLAGVWLNDHLIPVVAGFHAWAYQELYYRRPKRK